MSGCIHSVRWALSIFLLLVFSILILIGIPLAVATQSASNPDTVKQWLEDSGIYDTAIDSASDLIAGMMGEGVDDEIYKEELTDPDSEMNEKLNELITPEKIEGEANSAIDGIYDWLEGKTAKPRIMIELADDPEDFIDMLFFGLETKLESLPPCEPGYETPENLNPFEAECLPENFSSEDISAFLEENKDAEDLDEFAENAVISSDNFDIPQETTETVQSVYLVVKYFPTIAIAVFAILILILLLLIPDFPAKMYIVGITTLVSGGIVIIATYFNSYIYDTIWNTLTTGLPTDQLSLVEDTAGVIVQTILNDTVGKIRMWSIYTMITGGGLVTIGIVASILRKKSSQPEIPEGYSAAS